MFHQLPVIYENFIFYLQKIRYLILPFKHVINQYSSSLFQSICILFCFKIQEWLLSNWRKRIRILN